jgi:hypothetical protein
MEFEDKVLLFSKEEFQFNRTQKNHYTLNFNMENKNIYISKIIDFNLIKLIYDLNSDIYEKVEMNKFSDNEVSVILLMKHLFQDIGLPQRYSVINIKKYIENNKIIFQSNTIECDKPYGIPLEAEVLLIKNLTCVCNLITDHKVNFSFNIHFGEGTKIPPFAEKMIGMIIYKIFNRVKQFIENIVV